MATNQRPKPQLIQAGNQVPASPDLAALCLDLWTLKCDIDSQQQELDAMKARVIELLDGEGTVFDEGTYRITVAPRSSVGIADAAELERRLGDRFADLVTRKVTVSPSKNLLAIFEDPSHPDYGRVQDCLIVNSSVVLSMRADVPKDAKTARAA
ncbi:MAG: hypothetical protein IT518_14610 [Burkholderiales bacterium]|nr:hypothetical protein [Burkholderiales bacterium]